MKNRNTYITIIAIALFSLSCERTGNLKFSDWDRDDDNKIDPEEFQETFTENYYPDWNKKDNDYLDDEDLYKGTFAMYDLDNDNLLSEQEWLTGYEFYYGDYTVVDYDFVDTNSDGYIEYAEFRAVDDFANFFTDWNIQENEFITEYEIAIGVFNIWDIDESGFIEPDEYEEFDEYYLDM